MRRFPKIALTLLAALLLPPAGRSEQAGTAFELAIVVNRSTSVQKLSTDDLRKIYLGEEPSWPDGKKVLPAIFGSGSPELRLFLKSVCRMSEADYKRYFLQMIFEGKTVTQPRILASSTGVRTFVSSNPGAIGLIHSAEVDTSVAVVKLNGAVLSASAQKISDRR